MNVTTTNEPLALGTVVRAYGTPANTKELGIVKMVHAGTPLHPGWHYDVAWSGRTTIDRGVPAHVITVAN